MARATTPTPAAATHVSVTVTVACSSCGRPIVLLTDATGVTVPDRDGFLRTHRRCLAATADDRGRR